MIKAWTMEQLKRALSVADKKAAKLNPSVEIVEYGHYIVAGSKSSYEIRAGRTEENQLFIACTCRGALQSRACYHAAAVFPIHTAFATIKKTPKAKLPEPETRDQNDIPYLGPNRKPLTKIGNIRV